MELVWSSIAKLKCTYTIIYPCLSMGLNNTLSVDPKNAKWKSNDSLLQCVQIIIEICQKLRMINFKNWKSTYIVHLVSFTYVSLVKNWCLPYTPYTTSSSKQGDPYNLLLNLITFQKIMLSLNFQCAKNFTYMICELPTLQLQLSFHIYYIK